MAHWHDYNPWANKLIYVPSIAEVIGKKAEARILKQYGERVDAYILPQPEGIPPSFGVRYGKEGHEYLSPYVWHLQKHLERLITKYSNHNME